MKIKELLTDETKWNQGAFAVDKDGNRVGAGDEVAVKFCLLGAALRCYGGVTFGSPEYAAVREKICSVVGNPVVWNDNPETKFEDVKKLVETLDV